MSLDCSFDRKTLRISLRKARKNLSHDIQLFAEKQVARQLASCEFITSSSTIACYLSNDGEVSLSSFIAAQWQCADTRVTRITLPVIHPINKGHLLMLAYTRSTQMTENKYGIVEPTLTCNSIEPVKDHNVILMPLVGFDRQGNRLGMGGGYYDRTLSSVRNEKKRPKLVGIAHDCQEVNELPAQPWDVPLDAIVTPTRILHFKND